MKVIIFCGGKGTRLNKNLKKKILKPLLLVNKKPILKYIIEIYNKYNFNHFILLGGYKIKDLIKFKDKNKKKFRIEVFNTGLNTNTGGRLLKLKNKIKNEPFFLTYGDSLIEYSPKKAFRIWKKNNKKFLMTIFSYPFSYGRLELNKKNELKNFIEKKEILINAGYYILDNRIFKYIKGDESFEKKTIPRILKSKKLKFLTQKTKFWYPVDTIEDKINIKKILSET